MLPEFYNSQEQQVTIMYRDYHLHISRTTENKEQKYLHISKAFLKPYKEVTPLDDLIWKSGS